MPLHLVADSEIEYLCSTGVQFLLNVKPTCFKNVPLCLHFQLFLSSTELSKPKKVFLQVRKEDCSRTRYYSWLEQTRAQNQSVLCSTAFIDQSSPASVSQHLRSHQCLPTLLPYASHPDAWPTLLWAHRCFYKSITPASLDITVW